jgi:Fe-S cluster biogenesis protein NfuA
MIDRDFLKHTIDSLTRLIRAHAGGVELVDVDDANGAVTIRYTGMCVGCELRPVTTEGSVRPALLAIEGVREVIVLGSRISDEAQARLAEQLAPYGTHERAARLVRTAREVQR